MTSPSFLVTLWGRCAIAGYENHLSLASLVPFPTGCNSELQRPCEDSSMDSCWPEHKTHSCCEARQAPCAHTSHWLPADNHLRPLQLPPLSHAASFSYRATALTDQHSTEERQWGLFKSHLWTQRKTTLGFSTHKKQKTSRICTSNLNKNPKASFRAITP